MIKLYSSILSTRVFLERIISTPINISRGGKKRQQQIQQQQPEQQSSSPFPLPLPFPLPFAILKWKNEVYQKKGHKNKKDDDDVPIIISTNFTNAKKEWKWNFYKCIVSALWESLWYANIAHYHSNLSTPLLTFRFFHL